MRVIGFLLIIGIFFSYIPVFSMNECPEGDHMGNMKMDCGYLFHCPMVIDIIISENSKLPLNGLLVPTAISLSPDELPRPIFHPPKLIKTDFDPVGMKEEERPSMEFWHKNC